MLQTGSQPRMHVLVLAQTGKVLKRYPHFQDAFDDVRELWRFPLLRNLLAIALEVRN